MILGSGSQEPMAHQEELNQRQMFASVGSWRRPWDRYTAVMDLSGVDPKILACKVDKILEERRTQAARKIN